MSIAYRPSTRIIPPPPPEFAHEFATGGWRRVERLYGARTDQLVAWAAQTGAKSKASRSVAAVSEPADGGMVTA